MLTGAVENLLNRGLPRSPRARELCAELSGRRLAVEIRGLGRLIVESRGHSLGVLREAEGTADAEVSGHPLGLLALLRNSPEAVLQRGEVEIRGDAELAQRFRELGLLLRPDLEEELALLVGDVPAHQIGRLARAALGWTRRAADTTARNVAEYLAHERADLVPRAEGEQYLGGVDALREDVDRLAARIELLALRRGAGGKPD